MTNNFAASTAHGLPLTQGQQLMWMGQRLHSDAALYNMLFTFHIDGDIEPDTFRRAFDRLVTQTPILRSVFHEQDGIPYRIVSGFVPQQAEFIDLSTETNPQAAYDGLVAGRRARILPMDGCLYDCALIKLADKRYIWYFNQHHIITDVTSMRLLYVQMAGLYADVLAGRETPMPTGLRFEHYVEREQAICAGADFARATAYWQEQIAVPVEPIPFYSERTRTDSPRTERREFHMSDAHVALLQELSRRPGFRSFSRELTYANLLAALCIAFLHRLSGNEVIRLGTPFANRNTADERSIIGMLIEVLSLTVRLEPDDTFATLVRKVAASNMGALQHVMPGIGTAAHNRAYEVLLNFVTVSFPPFAGIPTVARWVHAGYGDSAHKLRVQAYDFNGRGHYGLAFDFNTQLFSEADQQRALEHFERMMDACLSAPDLPLHQIRLLDEQEWATLVQAFNATERAYPATETVVSLFEAQVRRTPQAVALTLGQTALSYLELSQRADALAAVLIRSGVGPDTLVPVCMAHSINLIVALLGILKAGGAYVPIDPVHPDARIAGMLEDIGTVPIIMADADQRARFASYRAEVITVAHSDSSAPADVLPSRASTRRLAYMIFTSGTTGRPKGVMIEHGSLTNYLWWAQQQYTNGTPTTFALYSSLAFDLTVTSIFVPLISGGSVRIYPDVEKNGMIIREVIREDAVDVVKLTPSHLALIRDQVPATQRIRAFIVGGEDFKTELAQAIHRVSNGRITQFNEYGPTEATVACMIHCYQPGQDVRASVPIGKPSDNMRVYILDRRLQPTPIGIVGEMYLAGINVARGYLNRAELTAERFLPDPLVPGARMYRSGDVARWLPGGQLEFLGRNDHQVKIGGVRIELAEVEAALLSHPAISEAVVDVRTSEKPISAVPRESITVTYCSRCGLASTFPGVTFDADGVCNVCREYDTYRDKARQYFKPMAELERIAARIKAQRSGAYDAVVLFSGGKDSTYMLYSVVEGLGLKVLAFTLDNGYISDEAKANIRRVTAALGVDHVFGQTPFMKTIFVDSLNRYANVCNGCFKTIYTLAINLARERGIRAIFTGLSRGQFFETRLTGELFSRPDFEVSAIDESIERARVAYHQRDDVISRSLDVDVFRSGAALHDVEFIDFYRYCDIDLSDLYSFLKERGLWNRPADTGRSTNCLINDVGIYIHTQKRGFHNYALPYSWDVRMGHKTRQEAIDELNDAIDPARVSRILREIGYHDPDSDKSGPQRLVAYIVADRALTAAEVRAYLGTVVTDAMIPSHVIQLDAMPLAPSGKVNRAALPDFDAGRSGLSTAYHAPTNEVESAVVEIWQAVLGVPQIGIHDDFFDLGGHSLPAIRIVSRINALYGIDFPIDQFFNAPTVAKLAAAVDGILLAEIAALSDDEVRQQLQGHGD